MRRAILRSAAFVRAAKRLQKKNPQAVDALFAALTWLEEDAFQPRLKTHKLKGDLEGLWACSFGHDLRIVFELSQHEGKDAILLQSLGTHNEVY